MQSYVKILVYDGWLLILACKHLDIITTTQHHHIASFWLRFLHPSVDLARDGEREKRTDGQTDREKTLFKRRIWNSPFFSFFKYVTFLGTGTGILGGEMHATMRNALAVPSMWYVMMAAVRVVVGVVMLICIFIDSLLFDEVLVS